MHTEMPFLMVAAHNQMHLLLENYGVIDKSVSLSLDNHSMRSAGQAAMIHFHEFGQQQSLCLQPSIEQEVQNGQRLHHHENGQKVELVTATVPSY